MIIEEKKTKKNKENSLWRPTVVTDQVVSKLEEGFSKGLTDVEACLYANISKKTLYRYIEKNPDFWHRKEELKQQPKMKAKLIINDKLDEKDDYNARWYLETKGKDEFSKKVETINENTNLNKDVTEELTEEQKRKIAERFMK